MPSAFCRAMTVIISSLVGVIAACHDSASHRSHRSVALQAVRQLLADRYSLVAVVQRGLLRAVEAGNQSALSCSCSARALFMCMAHIVASQRGLAPADQALARRLQQQLTTFLSLDAVRPSLDVLCLPRPGDGDALSQHGKLLDPRITVAAVHMIF